MKSLFITFLAVLLGSALVTSCETEFDTPPVRTLTDGDILSISLLRQIVSDSGGSYTFTDFYTVFGTSITDGVGGNFFKEFHLQDDSAGIKFTIDDVGIPYRGDYVRVNLRGATVFASNDMIEVTLDDSQANLVVIQDTQREIVPKTMTIDELRATLFGPEEERVESQLVRIENVEFSDADLGTTFADAITQGTLNKSIVECDNDDDIVVRTSGFASFAGTRLPGGNGAIEGVFTRFGTTPQLIIRDTDDVQFDALRCDGTTGNEQAIVIKDFEDQSLESGGWSQEVIAGGNDWYINSFNDNFYARASAFNGGNFGVADIWLISPAFDLASLNAPFLSFTMTTNFNGPTLETYVSTDYDEETGVSGATWILLDDIDYPTNVPTWTTVSSGPVDLTPFSSASTRVAFRYTSTDDEAATWDVDDIGIFDN